MELALPPERPCCLLHDAGAAPGDDVEAVFSQLPGDDDGPLIGFIPRLTRAEPKMETAG